MCLLCISYTYRCMHMPTLLGMNNKEKMFRCVSYICILCVCVCVAKTFCKVGMYQHTRTVPYRKDTAISELSFHITNATVLPHKDRTIRALALLPYLVKITMLQCYLIKIELYQSSYYISARHRGWQCYLVKVSLSEHYQSGCHGSS